MKVLWGTSLDAVRDGDRFDGEVFAAAETDDVLLRALDDAVEREEKIIMDAELPLWLSFVKWLGGIVGMVGTFIVSVGLFNIVAAIVHQYLGHIFTISCFLLGGLLMAAGVLWG